MVSRIYTDDNRVNIGNTVRIYVDLVYEFDGQPVTSADVTLGGSTTSYLGNGTWWLSWSRTHVTSECFENVSAVEHTFGLSLVNQNGQALTVIWDAVEVYEMGAPEWTLQGSEYSVWASARLAYDGQTLGANDSLVIADELATWNGSHFVVTVITDHVGPITFYANWTESVEFGVTVIAALANVTVRITDIPSITNVGSSFEPAGGRYEGVHLGNTLWIHWDPVNDPTPPTFNFTVAGVYIDSWTVTSAWSGVVIIQGNNTGEFTCTVESRLPYSVENYTYEIRVHNEAGLFSIAIVEVTVRDYTPPEISTPADLTIESGHYANITWKMADVHPDRLRLFIDGNPQEWQSWSIGRYSIRVGGTELVEHNYTIAAYDSWGNVVADSVLVTVRDTTPPEVTACDNIVYEAGTEGHNITWIVGDIHPALFQIIIDGVPGDCTEWNNGTVSISVDRLELGTHNYTIEVCDTSGNVATSTVMVTVVDTTPPQLTHPPDVVMSENSTGKHIRWYASDLYLACYAIFGNGVLIEFGEWSTTFETVAVELDGLSAGTYVYEIVVNDTSGNTAQNEVTVTMLQATTTPITTGSTTTTTATIPPTETGTTTTKGHDGIPLVVIAAAMGVGGLSVVIVVVCIVRRSHT